MRYVVILTGLVKGPCRQPYQTVKLFWLLNYADDFMVLFKCCPSKRENNVYEFQRKPWNKGAFTERNPRSYKRRVIFRFSDSSFQFVTSMSIDTITTTILTFHSNVSISRVALILKVIWSCVYRLKCSFYYACYLSCQTNFDDHITVKIQREAYGRWSFSLSTILNFLSFILLSSSFQALLSLLTYLRHEAESFLRS